MIIKVNSIQNKCLKRVVEHSVYLLLLITLIPGLFYFELCVVLPAVIELWTLEHYIHIVCATYLLLNILGNLICGSFTDTYIKSKILVKPEKANWTFCDVCECWRPPRAWHCKHCNICILKRDHHCTFFACCVGYFNHRYFMVFTLYIFVSMLYSFYFNVMFLRQFLTWNHGLVIIKFLFPLFSFVFDFGIESIYIFLVILNFIIALFSGFLLFFHLNNVLEGKTAPETKHGKEFVYNRGLKENLEEVFGAKWCLVWFWPFVVSPLPGDGIEWPIRTSIQINKKEM